MSVLHLVRHASTAWTGVRYCGRSDPDLDDAGRASARGLAAELRDVVAGGAAVMSSPLLRALRTAELIAEGSPVRVDDRLVEADFGAVDGCAFAEIERRWPAIGTALARRDPRVDWPDGESWSEVLVRARAFCADIARDRPAIVVTHGFVARAILLALGREDAPSLGAGGRLSLPL